MEHNIKRVNRNNYGPYFILYTEHGVIGYSPICCRSWPYDYPKSELRMPLRECSKLEFLLVSGVTSQQALERFVDTEGCYFYNLEDLMADLRARD
jgi:hypothetical protein